ncbi:MAG: plasmid pRiA4b ORF-3 family protein [Anaerolineae bacterium]
MAKRKSTPPADIYQLKVTLRHSKPPIWRRIQVPGNVLLSKLHRFLQVVMGWEDYHLHQFIVGGTFYGVPHPSYDDFGMKMENEGLVKLSQIAPEEKFKFIYEYDFGDSWEHELLVEKIMPPQKGIQYPRCVKGKRACPPEDCGGVWGYEELIEAINDPKHSEHDDLLEWLGGEFDPEEFDLDAINAVLARIR